nr:truncated L-threonine aldolase isoform [Mus musculus]
MLCSLFRAAMLRSLFRATVPGLRVPWAQWSRNWAGVPAHVVDLRSDTVTRPGPAMRRAMAEAVVGDDDYGEDPTVHELQEKAAELLGVERTLFVPTNTMANLISDRWGAFPPPPRPALWHLGPE